MKAAKSKKSPSAGSKGASVELSVDNVFDPSGLPTGPTGRYLVVLRDTGQKAMVKSLKSVAGLTDRKSVV